MKAWITIILTASLTCFAEQSQNAKSESHAERLARIEATPVNQIKDPDWRLILGEIQKENFTRFLPLLTNVVIQPGSPHFKETVYELGKLGSKAEAAVPALIVAYVNTNDSDIRYDIAEALGKIGAVAVAAVPLLIQAVKTETNNDRQVRIAAIDGLGGIGKPAKDALPFLRPLRKDKDSMIANAAVNALARISDNPDPYVLLLVQSSDIPIKKNVIPMWVSEAFDTFIALGPAAVGALPVIEKYLRDRNTDSITREQAIHAAGAIGPQAKPLLPTLEQLASDSKMEKDIRIAAASAIGSIESQPDKAKVRAALIEDEEQKAEELQWAKINASVAKYTSNLPKVTKVEVNAIRSGTLGDNPKSEDKIFPIRPYESNAQIGSQRTVEREEAERVAAAWRKLEFGWQFQAMCHEPVYGLRFYSGRKLLLETSVCWHCSNFYLPKGWFGFNGEAESGQALLKLLDSLLPYERPPAKKTED